MIYIGENDRIMHSEMFSLAAQHVNSNDDEQRIITLTFSVPITDPLPPQYYVRVKAEQ